MTSKVNLEVKFIHTLREVSKKMTVMDGARKTIRKIRQDCTRCRTILLKTIELELSKHHASRTIIAPPFFNVQIDIAYRFKAQPFKNLPPSPGFQLQFLFHTLVYHTVERESVFMYLRYFVKEKKRHW